MRFSTFNFKRISSVRNRRLLTALLFFTAAFALVVAGGEIGYRFLPSYMVWHGKMVEPPRNDEYIVEEAFSDHFDIYDSLYYGLGDVIENAKRADVLLLGNSRVLNAFPASSVRAFEQTTGVRVFNLCYPAGDGMVMAEKTIRRHNLKPAIVVVNANDFFLPSISYYALDTMTINSWRARMRVLEHRVSWYIRSRFHRLIPRFGFGPLDYPVPVLYFQSTKDGCLVAESLSPIRMRLASKKGVNTKRSLEYEKSELQYAKQFKNAMERMGIKVVLTNIPYDVDLFEPIKIMSKKLHVFWSIGDYPPFRRSIHLSKELGVPLVAPEVDGLETFDGNHLTKESSEKFALLFFSQFSKLPMVKDISKNK